VLAIPCFCQLVVGDGVSGAVPVSHEEVRHVPVSLSDDPRFGALVVVGLKEGSWIGQLCAAAAVAPPHRGRRWLGRAWPVVGSSPTRPTTVRDLRLVVTTVSLREPDHRPLF
jgi:hypothetical protein